jgi:hypothetical protein
VRYIDFRDVIEQELRRNPAGLTWTDLKRRLDLPYDRPCPAWVEQMSREVGLSRAKGAGRAHLWTVRPPTVRPRKQKRQ